MSPIALCLLVLAAHAHAVASDGGLQDLAAFPKYQVEFLNHLPLRESDAALVQRIGMAHEDEFLQLHPRRDTIDGGGEPPHEDEVVLVPLKYTPPGGTDMHSYLCALPSNGTTAAQAAAASLPHDEPEPDPEASWAALSHLDGRCLYQRNPMQWFTYSYCHNSHVKQFREKRILTEYNEKVVTEDTAYKSYTLGVAPNKAPRKDVRKVEGRRSSERTSSFGVSPASRYLVQRWTDGTRCDKTGRPREVEVQVHCAMASTDSLYMIKELQTCQYVVVIHSPQICSLPGFRPFSADDVTPAPVRCREVVTDADFEDWYTTKDAPQEPQDAGLLELPEGTEADERQVPVQEDRRAPAHGMGDILAGLAAGEDAETMLGIQQLMKTAFGAGLPLEALLGFGTDGDDETGVEEVEVEWDEEEEERRAELIKRLQAMSGGQQAQEQDQQSRKENSGGRKGSADKSKREPVKSKPKQPVKVVKQVEDVQEIWDEDDEEEWDEDEEERRAALVQQLLAMAGDQPGGARQEGIKRDPAKRKPQRRGTGKKQAKNAPARAGNGLDAQGIGLLVKLAFGAGLPLEAMLGLDDMGDEPRGTRPDDPPREPDEKEEERRAALVKQLLGMAKGEAEAAKSKQDDAASPEQKGEAPKAGKVDDSQRQEKKQAAEAQPRDEL